MSKAYSPGASQPAAHGHRAGEEASPVAEDSVRGSLYAGLADKAAAELEASTDDASGTHLEQIVVGALALAALLVCFYNIVVRYFAPAHTLEWSDEVQVYIIVWSMFLVLGVVTATDRHVKADLFVGMFSKSVQSKLLLFGDLLGLGFSCMLVYYGTIVTWQSYDFGDLSISSLRFPLWIYFAALPTGCLLMAIHYAIRIAQFFRGGRAS
ncbi:MAG: TRAP transporter small permease [Burkholderiaceae bacterium]